MSDGGPLPIVYIDSNVFIELLEGGPEQSARLEAFFELLRDRLGAAITSDLTRAEVLGKEAPTIGWEEQMQFYRGLFDLSPLIDVKTITSSILLDTADLRREARRAGRRIRLPDAIHLATALSAGCIYFLSSDRRLTWPWKLKFRAADDASLREISAALDA